MIGGGRTNLRAIERRDLAALLSWRNLPHFRRYFREHRELGMENQNRWFENVVVDNAAFRLFAIEAAATGRLIGACGLSYIDHRNANADMSIYIGADDLYIDDTFAPDAGRALIRYGFDHLNLHRIWSEIYATDVKKKAYFQKLGFTLEGTHRQTRWVGGAWVDSLFYGLLRGESDSGG